MMGKIYGKGKFWIWSGTEMHSESGDDDGDDDEPVRERWNDSDIRDRLAKFLGKFIPETRWGLAKRAIVDFQRGIRR